jgi:hypothetical protein
MWVAKLSGHFGHLCESTFRGDIQRLNHDMECHATLSSDDRNTGIAGHEKHEVAQKRIVDKGKLAFEPKRAIVGLLLGS